MSAERRIYQHVISPKGSFHDVFLHMANLLDEVTPMHTHTKMDLVTAQARVTLHGGVAEDECVVTSCG